MSQIKSLICFLQIECKLVWRQRTKSLGNIGVFFSLSIAVFMYALLHAVLGAVYFLLPIQIKLQIKLNLMPNLPGHTLFLLCVVMLAFSVPACIAILAERKDWDLILGSPISPYPVLAARMIGVGGQATLFPAFLLTPLFNLVAFSGKPTLLLIYPSLFILSLGMAAIGMILVLGVIRCLGLTHAQTFAKFSGITLAVLFLFLGQIENNMETLQGALSTFHEHWIFKQCNWLGTAFFGNGLALAVLAIFSITLFIFAILLMEPALTSATRPTATSPARRQHPTHHRFTGLAWQIAFKEWRLVYRDSRFFMFFLRLMMIVGAVLLLIYRSNQGIPPFFLVPAIVVICGMVANDLTWLMVIAEQVPELLLTSPIEIRKINTYKIFSALVPVSLILIVLTCVLITQDARAGLFALFFGLPAIGTSAAINLLFANKGRNMSRLETRIVRQRGLIVLAQGFSILFWAVLAYGLNDF